MNDTILRDLEQLAKDCRNRFADLPPELDIAIPEEFWNRFRTTYEQGNSDRIVQIGKNWFTITNGKERADLSARWLLYAYAFSRFYRHLVRYRNRLHFVISHLPTKNVRYDHNTRQAILAKLPSPTWRTDVDAIVAGTSALMDSLIQTALNGNPASVANFDRFLSDGPWWNSGKPGKKLDRGEKDWIGSAIRAATQVIQDTSGRLPWVVQAVAEDGALARDLMLMVRGAIPRTGPAATGGRNLIYYGAPGTGKSHRIDDLLKNVPDNCQIRTVFHADTQAGDFAGSLRPFSTETRTSYLFQPGPFTAALVRATNNPQKMHYLVIEEINRAAAASVFGEIFQLLDRNPDGSGKYRITPSDPAHAAYLATHLHGWDGSIRMPANLTILATMNSSDQGVMPMDTAFKRRWSFRYIPVDFATCAGGTVTVPSGAGARATVTWKAFACAVNDILAGLGVPEDRQLGPYFLTEKELAPAAPDEHDDDTEFGKDAVSGKLFMYLWDDVLRHGSRHALFPYAQTYGQLVRQYAAGGNVFSEALLKQLGLGTGVTAGSNEMTPA